MSQWIEVSIQTTHEAADLVAEIMRAAGANNGVVIEDPVLINTLRNSGTWELCDIPEQENTEVVTITAYYPEDEELQPRLTQIDEDLTNLETRIGKCRFGNTRFRTVSEQDSTSGPGTGSMARSALSPIFDPWLQAIAMVLHPVALAYTRPPTT